MIPARITSKLTSKLILSLLVLLHLGCSGNPVKENVTDSAGMDVDPAFDPLLDSDTSPVEYILESTQCKGRPCLKVELKFTNRSGKDRFRLPNQTAGQSELYRAVKNLGAVSPGAKLVKKSQPHRYEIRSKAGQIVSLKYELMQDFTGDLDTNERYYRAILQPEYFHVFGESLFVYPSLDVDSVRPIRLEWKLQKGSVVANSFGVKNTVQSIQTSLYLLRQGTFVGGGSPIQLSKISIRGKPVQIATVGKVGFSIVDFGRKVSKILEVEREFWRDHEFPTFFISALSTSKEVEIGGGQGRTNGFAIFSGEKAPTLRTALDRLLAHELFHTWNGHRILKQLREERIYWFSEGFTEYYAKLLLLRAEIYSLPEYISEVNADIQKYYASSARNATADTVESDFWKDSDVGKLPCLQGQMLARAWDSEIRLKSAEKYSLDAAMRDLMKESLEKNTPVSDSVIVELLRPFLDRDLSGEVARYIERGETIPLRPKTLGECVTGTLTKVISYDLGFDRAKTRTDKIATGVRDDGPAYRAGLREGDELAGISIWHGDIKKAVELTVSSGQERKLIKYLPIGKEQLVPQFVLDPVKFKELGKKCLAPFI